MRNQRRQQQSEENGGKSAAGMAAAKSSHINNNAIRHHNSEKHQSKQHGLGLISVASAKYGNQHESGEMAISSVAYQGA